MKINVHFDIATNLIDKGSQFLWHIFVISLNILISSIFMWIINSYYFLILFQILFFFLIFFLINLCKLFLYNNLLDHGPMLEDIS